MKHICIMYNAGAYGTFIEWALNYFSIELYNKEIDLPFTDQGTAHNFQGHRLLSYENVIDYINSDLNYSIIRFHPKTRKKEDISEVLTTITKNFKKVIYLTPTYSSILWNMNNKKEKIERKFHIEEEEEFYTPNLKNWNVLTVDEAEPWQLREFLSLFKYPQFMSETELNRLPQFQQTFSTVKFVPIDLLKNNFKDTIIDLLNYCELTPTNIDKIDSIHTVWKEKQFHMNKDQLINDIITAIISNTFYDWKQHNLTLIDEALIQYHLRQHNIEIKCYNLNSFPTNTDNLRTYFDYVT
jgi:hypothetical protein